MHDDYIVILVTCIYTLVTRPGSSLLDQIYIANVGNILGNILDDGRKGPTIAKLINVLFDLI